MPITDIRITGFYKGMSFPLTTVPVVNAVVFTTHELSKRVLGFHDENNFTIFEGMVTGAIAGLANCIVVTPVELVKCRLQLQTENKAKSYYKGTIDCILKIAREEGIRSLYLGNVATMLREIPAYAGKIVLSKFL